MKFQDRAAKLVTTQKEVSNVIAEVGMNWSQIAEPVKR